jgi:hypothetical protein
MALRVTSGGGCAAALLWVFAGGWIAAVAGFAWLATRGEIAPAAWAVLAIFALGGLWLVAMAIRATANAVRFRGASVELHEDSGVLGGKLTGVLHLREPMPLQLTLSNWHYDDSDDLIWESMPLPLDAGALDIPFSFDVPFDCEPTSDTASWRLLLESRDGAHGQSVPVPIVQTSASSPAQTRQALRAATYDAPAETKVIVERGAASTTVRLPLPSWVRLWYTLVILIDAMCAGAAIIWPDDTATIFGIAVLTTIVVCAIPLPTLAMTVRRIDADWRGLTLRFLMLRRAKTLPAGDVGAAYANGAEHYQLTFSGAVPPWTVVTLRSRAEAEWVAYELRLAQRS